MKRETENWMKALRIEKLNGNELEELLKTTNVIKVNREDLIAGEASFELGDYTVVCSTEEQTYSPYYSEDMYFQYRLTPRFRVKTEDYRSQHSRTYEKRSANETVICRIDIKNHSPPYSEDIHFGYFLIPI